MHHAKRLSLAVLCALLVAGCGSEGSDGDDVPASHTVNNAGVMHKPGLFDPMVNCTPCHGSNLQGSGDRPSCYRCHGQKW